MLWGLFEKGEEIFTIRPASNKLNRVYTRNQPQQQVIQGPLV